MNSLSKFKLITLIISVLIFILTGCSGTIQKIEVTVLVPQTIVITKVVIVTTTPLPPTETPEASPTSSFQKWTCDDVVQTFKKASLEISGEHPMTKEDYGIAPMRAVEGIHFFIPSLCSDCGGRILSFSNQSDLDITKTYYDELAKSSAMLFSWEFEKDNILVQINGDLPEEKARKYETALNAMSQ
jgi:hypothetical protein